MEIISYISSDSFVLFGRNILHNPRINCLKIWVRLWLFEGKSGANEHLIKMQGDYVLVCKGDKWLIPLACNQVIISFSWRTNLQMFIGSIKHDVTITKIKLSCVSFAPHSRIFLVGGSSISTASTTVRNWTASLKFHGLELPRKCRCHGKAFLSLTQSSQTRVPHEDM